MGVDRNAILEAAAVVCEAQAKAFLSPAYATGQPFGSISERFACAECAKAIRALKVSHTPQEGQEP